MNPLLHDQDSAFLPIEFQHSQLDDSLHESLESPTNIFRDVAPMDVSMPFVRRANPIREQQSNGTAEDAMDLRVISPYPFSASQEEIEEREQLTTVEWSLEHDEKRQQAPAIHIDFSQFFDVVSPAVHNNMEMPCDDFSLSSREANSLLSQDDICLESIPDDPASFWEEGIHRVATDRRVSPAEVSVGSSDRQSPVDTEFALNSMRAGMMR